MVAVLFLVIPFVIAQGGAVFVTAWFAMRFLKRSHWALKLLAMALSYVTWIGATLLAYFLLGGEGGFMDGFGFMLMLCTSALVSSLVYAAGWLIFPLFRSREAASEGV